MFFSAVQIGCTDFSTFVANNEEKCDAVSIIFVLLQSENGYGRPLT